MKNVLVLGAGFVSRPLVKYLLERKYHLTVADIEIKNARKVTAGHSNSKAVEFSAENESALKQMIDESDLAISLLPPSFHPMVAAKCIELKTNMVTTSYVSPAMKELDKPARKAGVVIINECGVDPGIDHMSAMRVIDGVRAKGGHVESFMSYCGGLPAPDSNTNPFGYKFSWSPRGVLSAGMQDGRYKKDGEEIFVEGRELFDHNWIVDVPGFGKLEAYPNRDSLGYIDTYKLRYAKTIFRGTLRYQGWCRTLKALVDLNYLDDSKDYGDLNTFEDLTAELLNNRSSEDLKSAVANRLSLQKNSRSLKNMEWLGLFSEEKIPRISGTPLDNIIEQMKKKMQYEESERDMIVLYHDFTAVNQDGSKKKITSTLIDYGEPNGNTSMARTVSLPSAVAAKMILEGRYDEPGVHIPVIPELYDPILNELEEIGIKCVEVEEPS